jgi:hypothetical protein
LPSAFLSPAVLLAATGEARYDATTAPVLPTLSPAGWKAAPLAPAVFIRAAQDDDPLVALWVVLDAE